MDALIEHTKTDDVALRDAGALAIRLEEPPAKNSSKQRNIQAQSHDSQSRYKNQRESGTKLHTAHHPEIKSTPQS